jgi:SNF2 family DNA or RNA helicase
MSSMLKDPKPLRFETRLAGYAYQLEAVEAVKNLPYAALFHEQGLGKTKIALDLALEWIRDSSVDSVLIVTKHGLVANWVEEIRRHTYLSAHVLDQNHSSNFFVLNSAARLYLTHYEAVKSEERRLKLFLKTRRVATILDESHKIKNPESETAKIFHRLSSGFVRRVIMTGTPIANRPFDLWSQIYFLDGGRALGSDFQDFREHLDLRNDLWSDKSKRERFEAGLAAAFDKIRPFTVRKTKDQAGIELPEKEIFNLLVEPEPKQWSLYEQYRNSLSATVMQGGQLIVDDAEAILKRLVRLVQIASNPLLIDDGYSAVPGKFPHLLRIIERALHEKSKIIIWTNFIENVRWLRKQLAQFGPVMVHGSMSIDERNQALADFKTDPAVNVLLATPGAAKEGLTLTVANYAVFYDRSFSLDDYLQAQDRIHRISQTQNCYVWNLICSGTVDEWLDSLLTAKRLAAQLTQADITADEYARLANYDFGMIVHDILGLKGRTHGGE